MAEVTSPVLHTPRLVLREFTPDDAPAVQAYASDFEVASTTLAMPHPYPEGGGAAWIEAHDEARESGTLPLAITRRKDGVVMGAIELRVVAEHRRGELGYTLARWEWGKGYATEAARALARWGFRELDLHRIHADCMARNPASGAVLRKLGMRLEGTQRRHVLRWGAYEDIERYGMLRDEFVDDEASPGA
ncbi:MAG TPA: GNAT family protein [Longimicrobium sp.]|nr:GNAT family protein [Longimicrobium sp.]